MRFKIYSSIFLAMIVFSSIHVVDSLAYTAYVTIEGASQGNITKDAGTRDSVGNLYVEGHEDECYVLSFGHSVEVPIDTTSGAPTSRRVHKPLRIVKPFDKATPLLMQALVNGENLVTVEIKFYRTGNTGLLEHFFTITLENAVIINISPSLIPTAADIQMMETVTFTYQKITWEHEVAGTSTSDDYRDPIS